MANVELVIKVDEDVYKDLIQTGENTIHLGILLDLKNIIKKGKLLPKGHGKLIDVSEYFKKEFGDAREFLDKATTIIEADKAGNEG